MKQQQTIECGRCGQTRLESLTKEEAAKLNDAIEPIYRHCQQCEKTTGWIRSTHSSAPTKETRPRSGKRQSAGRAAENWPLKGQERMATQAERDQVNSMVYDNARRLSSD